MFPPFHSSLSPPNMEESKPRKLSSNNNGGHHSQNQNHDYLLDTNLAERAMWLMKCPSIVARSLQFSPSYPDDPSRPIAKVILSIDPLVSDEDDGGNNDSSTQFTMELARAESGNMPKRYILDMSKDFIPMSVFCESSEGKVSVEGKILHKFDMRLHNDNIESYGKLCRERANKYMCRNRQIQVIDDATGMHMRPMPGMIIPTGNPEKKKVPNRTSEMKRTRRDRREMEEIMFKLFERQSNWTLRQLIQETDQPEQFLKDLLRDLCMYNNKGSNQGSYELKPEYKKTTEDQTNK
ncbi:PREDICTED: general transcription factor IIF subunit 2 [Tarenaya hassleriana]|uniref:general transcription factor IIF subunit 2 n=1 Tax=Tarenaya hassleriana TaxID=28532 RepID=UPI00053C29E5|nr:PREDICTED: general transcription factor IIF subunit 2 [Tarenaya hassleriana]